MSYLRSVQSCGGLVRCYLLAVTALLVAARLADSLAGQPRAKSRKRVELAKHRQSANSSCR